MVADCTFHLLKIGAVRSCLALASHAGSVSLPSQKGQLLSIACNYSLRTHCHVVGLLWAGNQNSVSGSSNNLIGDAPQDEAAQSTTPACCHHEKTSVIFGILEDLLAENISIANCGINFAGAPLDTLPHAFCLILEIAPCCEVF